MDACKEFNDGKINRTQLINITTAKGFKCVIDAFHVVDHSVIPIEFYAKDYSGARKQIVLTDEIFKLLELPFAENFAIETESRWNLVETAWALKISRNLLNVRYDASSQMFFVDSNFRRKDVTSARGALNGYQKGKCFYCFDDITVSDDNNNMCDVNHFFPHMLQPLFPDINLDGIWNLVLSCPRCSRGKNGKFALVPATKYLSRLHRRNEFLISSHHPLRETIIKQTGKTEAERKSFLASIDQRAIDILVHRWDTLPAAPATF